MSNLIATNAYLNLKRMITNLAITGRMNEALGVAANYSQKYSEVKQLLDEVKPDLTDAQYDELNELFQAALGD